MSEITNLKTNPSHIDDRGRISMVLESAQIGSVSIIDSVPNIERASHMHPRDNHTILILEGQIEIYERPSYDQKQKPTKTILNKGDIHLTENNIDHTMYFPCWTSFLCLSKLPRNTENYERETVRFKTSLREVYNNWED